MSTGDAARRDATALGVLGLVLITLSGALLALLECLLVPLYVGSTPFPLAVVLAVVGNIVLPRIARPMAAGARATVLPVLAWLLVVVLFGVVARPEGDVILPGGDLSWVTYAMVLGGALAAAVTVVTIGLPPRADRVTRRGPAERTTAQPAPGARKRR